MAAGNQSLPPVRAGFRRRDALELVKALLVTAFQAGQDSGGQS